MHSRSKFRLAGLALVALLPSPLKRPCYRHLFGYRIGRRVRVGLSVIDADECPGLIISPCPLCALCVSVVSAF